MKKNKILLLAAALLALVAAAAMAPRPELTIDEQNAVVEAAAQTLAADPDFMATVSANVEQDIIDRLNAAGYFGVAGALAAGNESAKTAETSDPTPTPTATPLPETAAETAEEAAADTEVEATEEAAAADTAAADDGEPEYDKAMDYWDGAVLQEDGTYRGLHAKFVNSYAYTLGGDNGNEKEFKTEYTPNVRFNIDVVFENDGSVVWPARIEMRHVGNVGEYTGHAESVYIDRTYDPVKPGDKVGFSVSCYGSENLGWTTFYFKLYDADSGSVIEGGEGSFTYHAI